MTRVPEVVVCILGADERGSILRSIASARGFGLPVVVGVHRRREILEGLENVAQHLIDWTGDFAAARNQILDRTRSQWILWLDSDETLFSFPRLDWSALPDDLHALSFQAVSLDMPYTRVRLHRNVPTIRWTGRIHEKLTQDGPEPASPRLLPGLAMIHSGYEDDAVLKAKDARNVAIARRTPSLDAMTWGELSAVARSQTTYGRFNITLWMRFLSHPERPANAYFDPRHEAALMLLSAGYAAPAAAILRANPLIVPLRLGLLAHDLRRTGAIDPVELDYLATVLAGGLFDIQYPFALVLLGADRTALEGHVRALAAEWKQMDRDMATDGAARAEDDIVYRRLADVEAEPFEDDLVLMHGVSWQALALNAVAAALWDALAWPQSPRQLTALLAEALPERDEGELACEVRATLGRLLSHDFIEARAA